LGTASLVIGFILIIIGFMIILLMLLTNAPTQEEWFDQVLGSLIVGIPIIVVGAVFLRKYDKDKRKISQKEDSSLEILKQRYAKGEITKEDYVKMKEELENS